MTNTETGAMTPTDYREIRERLGLSQEALARELQISTSTVQKREAGTSPIDTEAAIAIRSLLPSTEAA